MQRLLFTPSNPGLVIFDDLTGEVVDRLFLNDDRRRGNCYKVAGHWVALYVQDGAPILQIGPHQFPLNAASTKLEYWHHWSTGLTNFRVSQPAYEVALTYESWWSRIGLAAAQIKFAPEHDQEEDDMAYIYEVWKDSQMQRDLIAQWG